MMRVLTTEDEDLIRDYYLAVTTRELAYILNVPKGTISSAMRRMKLKVPKELASARKTDGLLAAAAKKAHPHDDLFRAEFLVTNVNQLSLKVNRSETYVKGRLKALGLVIPPEIIECRKQESRLKKGSVPPNKGRKQVEYMSAEQIEKTAATRFKTGQRVYNEAEDGAIRIRHSSKSRGGKAHKMIRLAKGKWKELQIFNWEQIHGAVPKKHVLACKDGDTLNCDPSNWELITMRENALRNQNREKAAESMKLAYQEGRVKNNPFLNLHDKIIAGYLFKGNPAAQEAALKHPELIELKRKQIQLNRIINEQKRSDSEQG